MIKMKEMIISKPDTEMENMYQPYDTDAGYDLRALEGSGIILPFQTKIVKANVRAQIPKGYHLEIIGRSGLSSKGILVHRGTIDPGYTGIIGVIMTNLKLRPVRFKKGERIAQMIIAKHEKPELVELSEPEFEVASASDRGGKGFGHSGTE